MLPGLIAGKPCLCQMPISLLRIISIIIILLASLHTSIAFRIQSRPLYQQKVYDVRALGSNQFQVQTLHQPCMLSPVRMQRSMYVSTTDTTDIDCVPHTNGIATVTPTDALSSAFGYVVGDIIAQIISRRFRLGRLLRMGLFGMLIHGTVGRTFHKWMTRAYDTFDGWTSAKKTLIEQAFLAPLLAVSLITFDLVLRGMSPLSVLPIVLKKAFALVITGWMLWPVAHLINYNYVPRSMKLQFINVCQLFSVALQSHIVNS